LKVLLKFCLRRGLVAAFVAVLASLTLAPRGAAQTFTWTGGSGNNRWTSGNNWSGGVAPTGAGGENLVFPSGAARLSNNNTLNGASFNSITISGSGYTLSGNALTLGAGGLADNSIAGTNTVSLPMTFAATRAVTVSNAGTTLTISGVISGAGGLTKAGAGTVTLSATNTYTGVTTINAGTIAVAADARLGTAPAVATPGKVTFGGGTLRTTASFTLAANRGIALTGAGTISTDPGTTLTYGGIIAGASTLTKAGTGTLILSGANTYTGATMVSAGSVRLGATNAVPSGSAVTVAGGATFDLSGFSDVVGSLAGAGTVTSGAAGGVTLTAGGDNSSTTFSSVIQNGSGTVALTKTGTGTLTLSGTNTYTGVTTINAGTIAIAADAGLGTAPAVPTPGRLTFGGGTLETTASFTLATNRGIALTGAGMISTDPGTTLTYGGIIAGASPLTKAGPGTLIVSGANTYTGATTVSAGVLDVRNNSGLGTPTGATTVASGAALQVDGSGLVIAEPLTLNGTGIASGGGLRNLANSNTWSGAITVGAGGARINSDAGTLTVSGAISGATQPLTVGGAGNTTVSGVIGTTSGTLTKDGIGTLILSAANTYTGATTVSAGALRLGAANAVGSGSAVTVAAGATFDLNGFSDAIGSLAGAGAVTSGAAGAVTLTAGGNNTSTTFSGVIQNGSATVAVTKVGTGTLTLSGTNTYTGSTTVSGGTLLVNGSQGSSAVSLNGGTLGGTGTVGPITSTGSGGSVTPGVGVGILSSGNVNWSSGSPGFVVQLNGTTAGTGYDQLNVTGSVNLGSATLSGTLGFSPPNGTSFTIINNDGSDAVIGTFAGLPEGSTVVLSGQSFKVSYVGGTGNDVVLTVAAPNLTVNNAVAPSASPPPGTDLTYTVTVTNNGTGNATSVVVVDTLAPTVQFKVGSVVNSLPAGVSVVVDYSNDAGATWTYIPASGACSAPANYDRCVNRVRWSLQNPLSSSAPNNTGTLQFVAQIR